MNSTKQKVILSKLVLIAVFVNPDLTPIKINSIG